jgi:4-hydroxy-L-threonine phosphate dehydrogenase PdxA
VTARVAIATGDPGGIGPEISLKAALDPEVGAICSPVVIGDRGALEAHARACGLSLRDISVLDRKQLSPGELKIGQISPVHGRAALDSAEAAIRAAGVEFDGYPSFVARAAGLPPEDGILMLCFEHAGREIRIAHVTLHASVRRCLAMITEERVLKTLRAVDIALKKLGCEKPEIAVSGVNPHAFGDEEERLIMPALEAARRDGMRVDGPIGADTLLQRTRCDAYVVMLHDQGHVAAKLLAPNRAAALTIGTPVLFSSVGHGAALDIAGQGRANPRAMVEAITRLVGRR